MWHSAATLDVYANREMPLRHGMQIRCKFIGQNVATHIQYQIKQARHTHDQLRCK